MKNTRYMKELILATFAWSLISCGNNVDFGFPFHPPATNSLVEITPANPSIPIGGTQQFTATETQANGTSIDVSTQVAWTSSNPSVATVNRGGLATALKPGPTTITATNGSMSGSTTLTVTSAILSSISVTPDHPLLPLGFALQLTATGIFADGTNFDVTTQATWTSSSNSVATVSGTGLVRGLALGDVTITAALGEISGTTTILVTRATLTSISISPANPSIPGTPAGITQQFTAIGAFSDGTNLDISTQVAWNSSNVSVATIDSSGLATCVAPGLSVITATFQTLSASTPLVVTSAALTSISVTPVNSSIHQGNTQQFVAMGTYSDGSNRDITPQVTWRSDNIGVARVDSTGLATAVAPGTATISASSGNTSGSVVLTVTP